MKLNEHSFSLSSPREIEGMAGIIGDDLHVSMVKHFHPMNAEMGALDVLEVLCFQRHVR
jgi:hypothetical protein